MVDIDIVNYFKKGLSNGYGIQVLKERLYQAGFQEKDIMAAIVYLDKEREIDNKNLGFFGRLKLSLISPGRLFEKTLVEHPVISLGSYLILAFLPFLIGAYFSYVNASNSTERIFKEVFFYLGGSSEGFLLYWLFLLVLISLTIFIVMPLFLAGYAFIQKVIVLIFGGHITYSDSYEVLNYSAFPLLILGAIYYPWTAFVGLFWMSILVVFGIVKYVRFSVLKAIIVVYLLPVIAGLVYLLLFSSFRVI